MSSLYKRKKSPYYMWSAYYKGIKIARSTKMRNKTHAKKVQAVWDLRLIKGELDFLGINPKTKYEIKEFVIHYLRFIETRKSANTVANSKTVLNRFLEYTDKNNIKLIDDVNVPVIDSFLDSMTISPKSKKNYHAILRVVFNQAIKEGLIDANPTLNATLPRIKRVIRHRLLDTIDLEIIYKYAGKWNNYYQFLYYTGLRAGDAALLKMENINLKKQVIVSFIRKSQKTYEIPLANCLIELLPKNANADTPLFPELYAEDSKTVNNKITAPRKHLQTILRLNDREKATLHSFRVTYNNALRDLGLSDKDRQVLLSHASSITTQLYTHPNFELASQFVNRLPKFGMKD